MAADLDTRWSLIRAVAVLRAAMLNLDAVASGPYLRREIRTQPTLIVSSAFGVRNLRENHGVFRRGSECKGSAAETT